MSRLSALLDAENDHSETYAVSELPKESRPETTYCLAGRLILSGGGSGSGSGDWLLLTVPNDLIYGLFSAMDEPGVEVPAESSTGRVNAHISVFRPEELESIGGADKVSERGKSFRYGLGQIRRVQPEGWDGMADCWFMTVVSPDLQELRQSYGLSALPNGGKFQFHITFAVRRKGVLSRNGKSKAAEFAERGLAHQLQHPVWEESQGIMPNLLTNASQAYQRGLDEANHQQAGEIFQAQSDPVVRLQMFNRSLAGRPATAVRDPIDALFFGGRVR